MDGLRAVAVLSVIFYHAFPKVFPGGFVGVDIFFVISGYLISGILFNGMKQEEFSLSEFYFRRVRRLFPSLVTTLWLCLGYGYFILWTEEYQQLGKHVAAGTLFIQNILYWKEGRYWDLAAIYNPVLHLWTLAVEGQFYIIFPPLTILFWKRKWPIAVILWILFSFSILSNLVMSTQDASADFYLISYRAWEFLAGSLLAWWHFSKSCEESATYNNLYATIGVILIVGSIFLINTRESYPGWRAIIPVVGTIALIAAHKQSWINREIFSNSLVVWIGLISYPLYLFHWPLISFVHIVKGENPPGIYLVLALGIALFLALTTYYFIEKQLRESKSRWVTLGLISSFLITGFLAVFINNGIILPLSCRNKEKSRLISIAIADNYKKIFTGYQRIRPRNSLVLLHKTGDYEMKSIFLGDSIMEQYAPRIYEIIKSNKDNQSAIFVTAGSVPPIPGVSKKNKQECYELIPRFKLTIADNDHIKNVIISALWPVYFSKSSEYYVNGVSMATKEGQDTGISNLGLMIRDLTRKGKKVILLLATPFDEKFNPKNMYRNNFYFSEKVIPDIKLEEYQNRYKEINSRITQEALKNGAIVFDPTPFFARDEYLLNEYNGEPIYFDGNHLRPSYVKQNIKYLDYIISK